MVDSVNSNTHWDECFIFLNVKVRPIRRNDIPMSSIVVYFLKEF